MKLKVDEKYKGEYKMLTKKWIATISSGSRDFVNWEDLLGHIGRGLNNVIFRVIFQYVVKLRVLFNMP